MYRPSSLRLAPLYRLAHVFLVLLALTAASVHPAFAQTWNPLYDSQAAVAGAAHNDFDGTHTPAQLGFTDTSVAGGEVTITPPSLVVHGDTSGYLHSFAARTGETHTTLKLHLTFTGAQVAASNNLFFGKRMPSGDFVAFQVSSGAGFAIYTLTGATLAQVGTSGSIAAPAAGDAMTVDVTIAPGTAANTVTTVGTVTDVTTGVTGTATDANDASAPLGAGAAFFGSNNGVFQTTRVQTYTQDAVTSSLTIGTLSAAPNGTSSAEATGILVSVSAPLSGGAAGGTYAYTYTRSTDPAFLAPAPAVLGTTTAATFLDTSAPAGVQEYYRVQGTDGTTTLYAVPSGLSGQAGSAGLSVSARMPALPCLLLAAADDSWGAIYSAGQRPLDYAAALLAQDTNRQVFVYDGANAGHNSNDLLPGAAAGDFAALEAGMGALTAAHPSGQLVILDNISGRNDSATAGPTGAPVALATFQANQHTIISQWLTNHPAAAVVLNGSTWYSPNRNSNGYTFDAAALARASAIQAALPGIVGAMASPRVFQGNTQSFGWFAAHYLTAMIAEPNVDGSLNYLHESPAGAQQEGAFQAEGVLRTALAAAQPALSVSAGAAALPLTTGASVQLAATLSGLPAGQTDAAITWTVLEGLPGGSVTAGGLYTAPSTPGTYHVVAASHLSPSVTAQVTLTVAAPALTPALTLATALSVQGKPVLTWTPDPLATGYRVLRSPDGVSYTVVATLGAVTTYTDAAAPVGDLHYHIVPIH